MFKIKLASFAIISLALVSCGDPAKEKVCSDLLKNIEISSNPNQVPTAGASAGAVLGIQAMQAKIDKAFADRKQKYMDEYTLKCKN